MAIYLIPAGNLELNGKIFPYKTDFLSEDSITKLLPKKALLQVYNDGRISSNLEGIDELQQSNWIGKTKKDVLQNEKI